MTPYEAMKNTDKEMYFRGDIFKRYDDKMKEDKYYLVVSSDARKQDYIQSVIPLYKEAKCDCAVDIVTTQGIRYANPNCVSYITATQLVEFVKSVTDEEMELIDKGILASLGLNEAGEKHPDITLDESVNAKELLKKVKLEPATMFYPQPPVELEKQLVEAKTEARIYKELYMALMQKNGVV